jgi:hypothetical protein
MLDDTGSTCANISGGRDLTTASVTGCFQLIPEAAAQHTETPAAQLPHSLLHLLGCCP